MATIYKRGKYWWVAFRNASGRRVQKSLKVGDEKAAKILKKHYEALEKAAFLKGTPLQQDILVGEWVREYRERRKARVAGRTIARDFQAIDSMRQAIKRRYLNRITKKDIDLWYNGVLGTRSPATANCLLRHLKVFFNAAVDDGYLPSTPCKHIKPVREVKKFIRVLTQEEVKAILAVMPPPWADLVRVALNTGARLGEICRLKVKDVDLLRKDPCITIRSTQKNPTKSKKARVVPLPYRSLPFFQQLTGEKDPEAYLLLSPSNTPWQPTWITHRFKRFCMDVGVSSATFHDLRRTYGAWLVMEGADLPTVQENLGHSNISVTINHYVHLVIGHRAEQTDKLPEV